MRDPHVVSLHYRLVPQEGTTFSVRAAPVQASADGFDVRLDGSELTATMNEHHASEQSARSVVDLYLRAWEVRHALAAAGGQLEFTFEFERGELIDRDPPPPGEPQTIEARVTVEGQAIISGRASVERGSLPTPPTDFVLDADAEAIWLRWRRYADGGESLQSTAYFVLTVLEMRGGRVAAGQQLGVSRSVLDTMARLASRTGDVLTARKADALGRPLTDQERAWLEVAIRTLVRRAGEVAADPQAPLMLVTMQDLPALGS